MQQRARTLTSELRTATELIHSVQHEIAAFADLDELKALAEAKREGLRRSA